MLQVNIVYNTSLNETLLIHTFKKLYNLIIQFIDVGNDRIDINMADIKLISPDTGLDIKMLHDTLFNITFKYKYSFNNTMFLCNMIEYYDLIMMQEKLHNKVHNYFLLLISDSLDIDIVPIMQVNKNAPTNDVIYDKGSINKYYISRIGITVLESIKHVNAICILIILAAIGKSAQAGLHM